MKKLTLLSLVITKRLLSLRRKSKRMECVITNQKTTVRQVLNEVYEDINWAYLAQNYFGKSRSWLYHKFSGRNNGKPDDFNDIDREKLKGALVDISNRLRMTADKL